MNRPTNLHEIRLEHLFAGRRHHPLAKLLIFNPVARLIIVILGLLLMVIIWPLAILYTLAKLVLAYWRNRRQNAKRSKIIDL
jgi:Flp pilus assembly protein TadB